MKEGSFGGLRRVAVADEVEHESWQEPAGSKILQVWRSRGVLRSHFKSAMRDKKEGPTPHPHTKLPDFVGGFGKSQYRPERA